MIDPINPLLRLNHNTPKLRHKRLRPPVLLTLLHRNTPILPNAAVNLQTLLIRRQLHLNACVGAGHCQDREIGSFGRGVAGPVEDEGVVVACAVVAALVRGEDVCADAFGGREVVGGSRDG